MALELVKEARPVQLPPSSLSSPEWCESIRELLQNDQAPRALKAADRALRDSVKRKDKAGEARARQMQVRVLFDLPGEDPDDIAEVAKVAAKSLKGVEDIKGELWTLRVLALLDAEALRVDDAIDVGNRMLAKSREADDVGLEGLAELTLAEVTLAGLRVEKSKDHAEMALQLFLRAGDRCGQGACHQVLSDLARQDSDADKALEAACKAQKYFVSGDLHVSREISGVAGALYRQALAQLDLAEEIEALRTAEKAVDACFQMSARDWEAQGLVLVAQAKLAVFDAKGEEGNINHSILKVAQIGADRVARHRPKHRTLMAQALVTLSDALIRTGGLHSAMSAAKDAKLFYQKAGLELLAAKAQLKLAEAEVGLGRGEQAKEDLTEVFKVFEAHKYFDGQDRALDLLDGAHKQLGLPTRAELAKEEQKKRQEELQRQQQLWAQQYYSQQQQQGLPAPTPQWMLPQGEGDSEIAKPKVTKEITRESSPLDLKAGMDVAVLKTKVSQIAAVIIGDDEFEADTPLMEAGLTSNAAVALRDELSKDLPGIKLPHTLIFDYPSVAGIADFVVDQSHMIAG
ncbi:unnamed protein product [Effrenium voratum]|uniref:Carrier domain-containing protein n=1 Tax=Effrenium voratum TaxID=2562239 RepID=A0AA36NHB3_9DINO|nr:unnamed protein product [Effrenium voratum]